jgi:thioredoxin-related protein
MKKYAIYSLIVGVIILFSSFKPQSEAITWLSFEQVLAASKNAKRKVFIDVYTDWCGWCKKMDASTFSDLKVAKYVNKKFYAVKLNAESSKTFQMDGKTISERELAQMFKVSAFPTTVYLDENLSMLSPVPGYLDIPTFDKILKFYGENNYKSQSWDEFNKTYKAD